ncbi:uncharacterized protein BT62DRAFT_575427 [Guyanagaster necrorhizus]|uniref:Uncharacterized protein n=1 Tax=Guyanagaster necrorhizus TaxID=856835 RepID=A0A9P7VHI6_9AGAR|nr:uncharacterized protein BT62DRAFT_575427 [Guyanagaster necrorhizus MCA 3950]KAG7440667.1 hypothetical protein BT62DRAFT_575427 [Guyanagaster necrorhizus MCA 3950]
MVIMYVMLSHSQSYRCCQPHRGCFAQQCCHRGRNTPMVAILASKQVSLEFFRVLYGPPVFTANKPRRDLLPLHVNHFPFFCGRMLFSMAESWPESTTTTAYILPFIYYVLLMVYFTCMEYFWDSPLFLLLVSLE